MSKNRFSFLVALVAAIMITGCSHQPTAPSVGGSQADRGMAPPAALNPSNPDDIVGLGKRLTRDRLSLYSVSQGQYTFYVGRVLSATYETATEILRVSGLTADDEVEQVCEYSPQGVLFIDPNAQRDKDAFVDSCNQLVVRLNGYLTR